MPHVPEEAPDARPNGYASVLPGLLHHRQLPIRRERLEGDEVKRSERTPRSQIRQALRRLSLRSRERAACLKRDRYTCQRCGAKQSRAKGREVYVEAHHTKGILWDVLVDSVYEMLLCHPDDMITLCKECHAKETVCHEADNIL